MLRRLQNKDDGFTLVEILVTMIVIGILATIAIPVFMAQKFKAADTAIKSDLRNLVSHMESFDDGYPTAQQLHDAGIDLKTSAGSIVTVVWANKDGYCLAGTNSKASKAQSPLMGIPTKVFYFNSAGGGQKSVDVSGPGCLTQSGASINNGYFDSTGFHTGAPRL